MGNLVELSGLSPLRAANKAQIAEFFDVSVKAVDGWVRRGCPVVKRGNRSTPWQLDALAVAEWRFGGGSSAEEVDPDLLTPQDRKAWYESEAKRLDLQERSRELITAQEVERVIALTFSAIAQNLRAIPDNLERRHGISGEVAEMVESALFESMDEMADRLSSLAAVEEE